MIAVIGRKPVVRDEWARLETNSCKLPVGAEELRALQVKFKTQTVVFFIEIIRVTCFVRLQITNF